MSSENAIAAEARQRLQHIRSLPETPMRKREMVALERVIAGAAQMTPSAARAPRRKASITAAAEAALDNEPEQPSRPAREVQQIGARRRVIVRQAKPVVKTHEDDDLEMAAEHKRRIDDIRSTLGLQHRGMS